MTASTHRAPDVARTDQPPRETAGGQAAAGTGAAGRPAARRRRNRRMRGLSTLVGIEILLAVGVLIWVITDHRLGWIALAIAALAALMVLPLVGGRSLLGRWSRRAEFTLARSRRRSVDLMPPPFDIPAGARSTMHPGAPRAATPTGAAEGDEALIGARWAGGTLITVLRVHPAVPGLTYLSPQGARLGDPTGQLVPLAALAECIDPFDIPVTSIDVVSHGVRSRGHGPVADSYRRTLGPLPATAHRSVLVIVRLDPQNCPDAVARRGGGAVGALRTATITTRRVARRLAESGLRVATLSAAEITMLPGHLTDGGSLDSLTESWTAVTDSSSRLRLRSAAIEPDAFERVLSDAWADTALSTTTTVRLGHDPDGVLQVRGLVRFDDVADAGAADPAWPDGLRPLDGRQFDALTASLPVATPSRGPRDVPAVTGVEAAALLDRLALPAAGCGQLVGADHTGRAVAVRLVGSDIGQVTIVGGHHLAAQVVLRAVAVGASVVVHTSTPARWQPLLGAVGDARLLTLAGDRPAPTVGPRVDLYDGIPARAAEPHATRIVVVPPGDPRERDAAAGAAVVLRQNPRAPQDISVFTGSERTQVTMVATPDEWALTGARPR